MSVTELVPKESQISVGSYVDQSNFYSIIHSEKLKNTQKSTVVSKNPHLNIVDYLNAEETKSTKIERFKEKDPKKLSDVVELLSD